MRRGSRKKRRRWSRGEKRRRTWKRRMRRRERRKFRGRRRCSRRSNAGNVPDESPDPNRHTAK